MLVVPSRADSLVASVSAESARGAQLVGRRIGTTPQDRGAGGAGGAGGTGGTGDRLSVAVMLALATELDGSSPPPDGRWTECSGRRFTRLARGELHEAWLIEWSHASSLGPHSHGGSHGIVVVVAGRLVERYVEGALPNPWRTRTLRRGDAIIVPSSRVHEMMNPGPETAVSLHVYSPGLEAAAGDLLPANARHSG